MGENITIGADTFEGLSSLVSCSYLDRASVYSIWTQIEIGRYKLLYIGESGETGTRLDNGHHKYQCWVNNNINGLYVAFMWMPSNLYTKEQRFTKESELIGRYNPVCND